MTTPSPAVYNPAGPMEGDQTVCPLLEVRALRKEFPGVVAMADIDFDLRRGEVHAVVGENGAGKSTLGRAIAGVVRPDAGTMLLRGRRFAPVSRLETQKAGVYMVMQELNLIGTLSVAENIFLNRLPRRFGFIDRRRLAAEARRVMERVGLDDVPPDTPVEQLGIGQQQMVEIAAGLSRQCDVMIFDEPTAALTGRETEMLFAQIASLKSAGVGIIYISHRMEEITRIADRITVLRDGRRIATHRAGEVSIDRIITEMVGRELRDTVWRPRPRGALALRVRGLRCGKALRDVSFDLHRGEILGFAGLMGSGRTQTMRAIFGADLPEGGEIYLHGSQSPVRIRSPRQAVKLGIALLTEDRRRQGLFLPLSVRFNATLACIARLAALRTWVRAGRERDEAQRLVRLLSIRCHCLDQPAAGLSGGNQQKVVMARWLLRDCDILLFDEPTRGIDVGAKFEIYELLHELASRGKAIAMVSSDLMELMAVCDRIAVMSAGRLVRIFDRGAWTQDAIMAAAVTGEQKAGGAPGVSAGA